MKNILTGLAVAVLGAWCLVSLITVLGLGVESRDPGTGYTFEWFTWILIAPLLALGASIVIALLWTLGAKVNGDD